MKINATSEMIARSNFVYVITFAFFTHMNEIDLMHLFQGCLGLDYMLYSSKIRVNGLLLKHRNEAKYDKANNNKGIR